MRLRFGGSGHAVGERLLGALALTAACAWTSCQTPEGAREKSDDRAQAIIEEAQEKVLGRTEPFDIEPPAETLRRRLLLDQVLPHTSPASLNSRDVERIEQWPDPDYGTGGPVTEPRWDSTRELELGLVDTLEIGARNSREYQRQKELVFRTALALDLEQDAFRKTWFGILSSSYSVDSSVDPTVEGLENTLAAGVSERLKNGAAYSLGIAVDLVKLLTQGEDSSLGLLVDATISVPLLRGSSKFVVTEPLKQAEREVIYAIYLFERFKRVFAVDVATEFYEVLQLRREMENQLENYRWLIGATRRARRMTEAQRLEPIEFDQTLQDELEARDSWVEAKRVYESRLDEFKLFIGLPVDARISLDQDALADLAEFGEYSARDEGHVPADAPIVVEPPSDEGAGPFELDPEEAVVLALGNRLDLRAALGRIFDAQRKAAVAADGLRADLTLLGNASWGDRRTLSDALLDDATLEGNEGRYSLLALLDLPLERTAERILYRASLIAFEESVRGLQELEDQAKLEVRDDLRVLRESRERARIQARSVTLAERRVESTSRFLEVDLADARDVLEAQMDLVDARNALSFELVRYRLAELALQRDLGLLQVDHQGLWTEMVTE